MRDRPVSENFIDWYLYACGVSEVPDTFHLWCCMSLLAASVQDRVQVAWGSRDTLPLNLYVFLVAGSGVGKDQAISRAFAMASEVPSLNAIQARVTAPFVLDHLSQKGKNQTYFITEELGQAIRAGEQAKDLIANMTKLYSSRKGVSLMDGTVSRGTVIIKNPCVNWLAGSNPRWLAESIGTSGFEGGFWPRVIGVMEEKDYNVRIPEPQYPDDWKDVWDELTARLQEYAAVDHTVLTFTEASQTLYDAWYCEREAPTPDVAPAWNRGAEMVRKLSGVLAIAEWNPLIEGKEPVIEVEQLEEAIELWDTILHQIQRILEETSVTPISLHMKKIVQVLKGEAELSRSQLLKKVSSSGIHKKDVDVVIESLVERGDVKEWKKRPGGAMYYKWEPEETVLAPVAELYDDVEGWS